MSSSSPGNMPARCPICGKETAEAYRPFCSKRCADVDLARWFTGSYAVAGREEDEGDNATPADDRKRLNGEDDEG
jgi:endogenous inhibitor of DNA gyrase (YacG/DUF329 family)